MRIHTDASRCRECQACVLACSLFHAHREGRFRDREPLPFWVISAMMHISESRDPTIGTHQSSLLLGDFVCDFGFPQLVRPMESYDEWQTATDIVGDLDLDRRLFAAVTGVEMSRAELDRAAERGFTLERLMLARAGRGRRMEETLAPHFELPCQSDGTYVDKAGFSRLLDEYYAARGWDLEFGWPTADRLRQLGLEDTIPELMEYRRRFADAGVGSRV